MEKNTHSIESKIQGSLDSKESLYKEIINDPKYNLDLSKLVEVVRDKYPVSAGTLFNAFGGKENTFLKSILDIYTEDQSDEKLGLIYRNMCSALMSFNESQREIILNYKDYCGADGNQDACKALQLDVKDFLVQSMTFPGAAFTDSY